MTEPMAAPGSGDRKNEPSTSTSNAVPLGIVVGGRYRTVSLISQRDGVMRFRGVDLRSGQIDPLPIIIVREEHPPDSDPQPIDDLAAPAGITANEDPESLLADTKIDVAPVWPGIRWERRLLARTPHLSIPRVLDGFREGGFEYLIEEVPLGSSFWDAWDERPISWRRRCEWLIQIAEALDQLHAAGAIFEGLSPDLIVVTPTSQAVFADLTNVLPLPIPANVQLRGGLYTAPELIQRSIDADSQADLYSFGAMVQALLYGRELSDLDFSDGLPRLYLEWDGDAHPMLGRLLARTFTLEPACRFPSPDKFEADPTGFRELIETLLACGKTLDAVRLDVAAWSNTGVVRSGNEDAVAVLHSTESRQEDCDDFAVVVLADGMGGMASGELAAALTIQSVRDYFLRHSPFTELLISPATTAEPSPPADYPALIETALREANRLVYDEARKTSSHRGMGCTVEVVLVDGKKVHVGHVGDSRVYHIRRGKIHQVTMDHTLVSQLVALGQLTEAEAERHPQRSELQQAIGGRRDVYPDHTTFTLETGDWVLVCSDGLSNQLTKETMASVMKSAGSAEKAARRLVNQTILHGALDNVTVVVIRAC